MIPHFPDKLPLQDLDWSAFIENLGPANRSLARYDGLLQSIPNPSVLLSPLTTQEAVLSSKIEGTQATLEEVLRFEANPSRHVERYHDIQEIINYRKAMAFAVGTLKERPLNLNLLLQMHHFLLEGVRGQDKSRGKFRTTQNWIGKPGSPIEAARFIPPNPLELPFALNEFEKYLHFDEKDVLVQTAIIHAQFEILHPFNDGNGRIGRILVPLFLFDRKILQQPMFYISSYLEQNRTAYYDQLKEITDSGRWESWIRFFLKAIETQARKNIEKARQILSLYEEMKVEIVRGTHSQFSLPSLDCIFNLPVFTSADFERQSGIPRASVGRLLKLMTASGIIHIMEKGVGRRPAVYIFKRLIDIVNKTD